MLDQVTLREQAAKLGWFHSIPLGDGTWTEGHKSRQHLEQEEKSWRFPADLSGKTVLDIGCADGYWSNLAVKRGAKSVLAVDEQVTGGLRFLLDAGFYSFEFKNISILDDGFLSLPAFDFVIFAGVIYHTKHPLLALERLYKVTKLEAIVETHLDQRYGDKVPLMAFYETDELHGAADNWWGPNLPCMTAMLRVAGFTRIEMTHFGQGPVGYDRASFRVSP
jgi:tRNA (mo5U34)-methyltransferase